MISVTTDHVPARERTEYWADLVSRHVTPIRIEPAGPDVLRGSIRARAIGDLGAAQVSGQGVRAVHTAAHIARATDHVYAAGVHVAGEAWIVRRGEAIALRPGDVFLTDSRQPFTFALHRPWRHLLITLPTRWLDARVTRPDLLAGAVMRDQPLSRLWARHLATGFALAADLSAAAAALVARQSLELLAQLVEESHRDAATPSASTRAAMFDTACRVISLRYSDPSLTPADIAREIGVSTRTLARLFAQQNESVMRRIMDERVRHAARLLASPAAAHRSVTEIAFACGFNDLSHFGRAFAKRMDMTPSQWRRRGGR